MTALMHAKDSQVSLNTNIRSGAVTVPSHVDTIMGSPVPSTSYHTPGSPPTTSAHSPTIGDAELENEPSTDSLSNDNSTAPPHVGLVTMIGSPRVVSSSTVRLNSPVRSVVPWTVRYEKGHNHRMSPHIQKNSPKQALRIHSPKM